MPGKVKLGHTRHDPGSQGATQTGVWRGLAPLTLRDNNWQLPDRGLISSSNKMDFRALYLTESRGLVTGVLTSCGLLPGSPVKWVTGRFVGWMNGWLVAPPQDARWQPGADWQVVPD